jgi:hypothetical protein
MLLLPLPFVTVLGLIAAFIIHPVAGADLQRRGHANQVNYYSDPNCQYYQGSWPGPKHNTRKKEPWRVPIDEREVGSVIVLPGKKKAHNAPYPNPVQTFTLFTVNNTTCIGIQGSKCHCQKPVENKGEDKKNLCYSINETVTYLMFSTPNC